MGPLLPHDILALGIRSIRFTHQTRDRFFPEAFWLAVVGEMPKRIHFKPADRFHGHKIRPTSRRCCIVTLPLALEPIAEKLRGHYQIHVGENGSHYIDLRDEHAHD